MLFFLGIYRDKFNYKMFSWEKFERGNTDSKKSSYLLLYAAIYNFIKCIQYSNMVVTQGAACAKVNGTVFLKAQSTQHCNSLVSDSRGGNDGMRSKFVVTGLLKISTSMVGMITHDPT